jgi:lincosamide nucleotidyltransferase A/C/D/E
MAAGGIRVWLDGGWAVDASLGSQTRPHSDLDIVIEERHVERLGYDDTGRKVDFHVIVLDE